MAVRASCYRYNNIIMSLVRMGKGGPPAGSGRNDSANNGSLTQRFIRHSNEDPVLSFNNHSLPLSALGLGI